MKFIELTEGQCAKVDDEDYEWVNAFKWYALWSPTRQSYYAVRDIVDENGETRIVWMHVEIAARHGMIKHSYTTPKEKRKKCREYH